MTPVPLNDRLIVALDVKSLKDAERILDLLLPEVRFFKIGLELMAAEGAPSAVKLIQEKGGKVFFDGKFNDIPATMAGAARAASKLGVDFLTVHASSGVKAMECAVAEKGSTRVLAVTVLTALDDESSRHIFGKGAEEKVVEFADDALSAKVDGVVCSPAELSLLKDPRFKKLIKVIPGIRPSWAATQDQKRVLTPAQALREGADWLVVGRPITAPPSGTPREAAERVLREMAEGIEP